MNLMVGLTNPRAMKLQGMANQELVIVLVDCGVTHNFVSLRVVELLKILLVKTRNYSVIMGTRIVVEGKEVCEAVELNLGEMRIVVDFLPLELRGTDVILGMQWLHTLGVTEMDWRNLTLKVKQGGRTMILRGDPSRTKSRVNLRRMMNSSDVNDQGYLIEC